MPLFFFNETFACYKSVTTAFNLTAIFYWCKYWSFAVWPPLFSRSLLAKIASDSNPGEMHHYAGHTYQKAKIQFVQCCSRVVYNLKVGIIWWLLHLQVHYVVVLNYEVVPDCRDGHQTCHYYCNSKGLRSWRGRLVFLKLSEVYSHLLHELYQESHWEYSSQGMHD